MSPRFEIEVPAERTEAFRQHVGIFSDATVIFDQDLYELEHAEEIDANLPVNMRELPHLSQIEALTQPIEDDNLKGIKKGYSVLLERVFSGAEDEAIVTIETNEDLFWLQEKIQAALRTVDHPRHAGVVIDKFGLVSGKPKKNTQIAQNLGITNGRLRADQKKAFEKIAGLREDRDVFPRLVQFVPKLSHTSK
jgi:DNA-directed RNA polymerase sigma subunit (sigma70/sigma32)